MLNKARDQVLVEYSIGLLGDDRVDTVGAGGHGGAVRGNGDLERYKGARAKIGFGRGKDVGKPVDDVVEVLDDRWKPAKTVRVERNVA